MLSRIFAVFRARNLEFVRDRGTMSWNLLLPIGLMLGLSFVFGDEDRAEYTIGVLASQAVLDESSHPILGTRYMEFVVVDDESAAVRKVARHQLDLLVDLGEPTRYWVNPDSPKGYFAELALLEATDARVEKQEISGDAVRYVDWVLPGILGMNMMFSSLFGVGYVVVRYRKNGFLKRLRATPLRAFEFVVAQVLSRLMLTMLITTGVFTGITLLLDIHIEGSAFLLFIIGLTGAVTLISMGLLVASRVTSEELAGGLLNLVTWPMMLLSGVWFSLEGAQEWVRQIARLFPLTHILDSARAVMLDGAGLTDIAGDLLALVVMSAAFMALSAVLFRWRAT